MDSKYIEKILSDFMGHQVEITSYDALAPVWRKLADTIAPVTRTVREPEVWFDAEPREHAEALATAILAAKER